MCALCLETPQYYSSAIAFNIVLPTRKKAKKKANFKHSVYIYFLVLCGI